jgi:CCR4-NOT transcription complex subunit 7/8
MICKPLPDDEVEFDMLMKKFFPSVYDVKYLMKQAIRSYQTGQLTPADQNTLDVLNKFEQKSSLENLAEVLKVKRQGQAHQAGSDALLTGKVFFRMREILYNGDISDDHLSKVWGLGFPDSGAQGFSNTNAQQYANGNDNSGQNGGYANGPSTPNNNHVNMVSTPAPSGTTSGMATPGAGGAFGNFKYGQ